MLYPFHLSQPLYIQSGDESSLDTNSNPYRNVKEGVESILRAEVSKIDAGKWTG
jgi:hypothetical protein